MATIEDYQQNLSRIDHEIEQNAKMKKTLKEKIQDMLDDIEDLKDEGADRKEIRAAKKDLDKFYKQVDSISSNYYWLRQQKKICEQSIEHLQRKA